MVDQPITDVFCSAPVAMHHNLLGTINPGWNRGHDPAKLKTVLDAQRHDGARNVLHLKPVPCKRDADGFVWSDEAADFVDPELVRAKVKATEKTEAPKSETTRIAPAKDDKN